MINTAKSQLQKDLENYQILYKNEKEKNEQLQREITDIEQYKELNLSLQVKVKEQENKIRDLEEYNAIISNKCSTYETVFDILKINNEKE